MTERVLLVEDDVPTQNLVVHHLRRAGYEVLVAGTGRQGLARVRDDDPDLVILEAMLPDADGFEVCKEIRKHRDTPIMFLSARDDEIDRVVGFEVGADDYVTKPFSPRELVGRVKAILRRSVDHAVVERSAYAMGPLVIDFDTYEVTRYGERIPMTLTEFKILKVLVDHPGQVLSRRELLDHALGLEYTGDLKVVDVHIRHLRIKLEEDPANPQLIQTVRAVGYKFTGPVS